MNPIKKQPIAVAIAVTVKAAPLLIPAALKILGLTKRMYDNETNVVRAAINSRLTLVCASSK